MTFRSCAARSRTPPPPVALGVVHDAGVATAEIAENRPEPPFRTSADSVRPRGVRASAAARPIRRNRSALRRGRPAFLAGDRTGERPAGLPVWTRGKFFKTLAKPRVFPYDAPRRTSPVRPVNELVRMADCTRRAGGAARKVVCDRRLHDEPRRGRRLVGGTLFGFWRRPRPWRDRFRWDLRYVGRSRPCAVAVGFTWTAGPSCGPCFTWGRRTGSVLCQRLQTRRGSTRVRRRRGKVRF